MPSAEFPLDVEFGTDAQRHRYFLVDVFNDTALAGNQLGVFADARALSGDDMQRLARELNLSETVFVLPAEQGGDVAIRIFTPATELAFAGHPVLGTAFVVGSALGSEVVRLETGLGIVPVALERAAGRRDRDPAGRGDRAPVDPLCPRRREHRRRRAGAGRRAGGHRRPRRVPPSLNRSPGSTG